MNNTHSEEFFDYYIKVSSNNLLKQELTNLKTIADEVLQEWKSMNGDPHKISVRHTHLQIEHDGESGFYVVIHGLGMPDHIYKNKMERDLEEGIRNKWGLWVTVLYEQGY
jgi:hypothetical protein